MRHLVLVLGDELDAHAAALDRTDPSRDVVAMAEVEAEVTEPCEADPYADPVSLS